MARRIYRQRVIVAASPKRCSMPEMAVPLRVEAVRIGVSANAPHAVDFWYEHDDEMPEVERAFIVVGTGHEIPADTFYQGTTARTEDGLVWHLCEFYKKDGEA